MVVKRKAKPDFEKVKKKVGKTKKQQQSSSVTDTSFTAKQVKIRNATPGHASESKSREQLTHRNLSIAQLLARMDHHNPKSRKDAVMGILELLQSKSSSSKKTSEDDSVYLLFGPGIMQLLHRLLLLLHDGDKSVRQSLRACMNGFLDCFPGLFTQRKNVMDMILAQVLSALTNIKLEIQHDSLLFLSIIIERFPNDSCILWTPSRTFTSLIDPLLVFMLKQLDVHATTFEGKRKGSSDIFSKSISIATCLSQCLSVSTDSVENLYSVTSSDLLTVLDYSDNTSSILSDSSHVSSVQFADKFCKFSKDSIKSLYSYISENEKFSSRAVHATLIELLQLLCSALKFFASDKQSISDKIEDTLIDVHELLISLHTIHNYDLQLYVCEAICEIADIIQVPNKVKIIYVKVVDLLCNIVKSFQSLESTKLLSSVCNKVLQGLNSHGDEGKSCFRKVFKSLIDLFSQKSEDLSSQLVVFDILSEFLKWEGFHSLEESKGFISELPSVVKDLNSCKTQDYSQVVAKMFSFIEMCFQKINSASDTLLNLQKNIFVTFFSNHDNSSSFFALSSEVQSSLIRVIYYCPSLGRAELTCIISIASAEQSDVQMQANILRNSFHSLINQCLNNPQNFQTLNQQGRAEQVSSMLSLSLSAILKCSNTMVNTVLDCISEIPSQYCSDFATMLLNGLEKHYGDADDERKELIAISVLHVSQLLSSEILFNNLDLHHLCSSRTTHQTTTQTSSTFL